MSELSGRSIAPKMRSRRKGCHLCTGEVRDLEVQYSENATARRQVQYVGELSALPETALAAAFARALARRELRR
jgi:hypothetical protein